MPTLELEKLGVESLESSEALSQIVGGAGETAQVLLYGTRSSQNGTATFQPNGTALVSDDNGTPFPESPLVDPDRDGFFTDPTDRFFADTQGNPNIPLYFGDNTRRTPIFAPGYFE